MGVLSSEPYTPPLEIVKVPPRSSSSVKSPAFRLARKFLDGLLDFRKPHAVSIPQHRNHQAFRAPHRPRRCRNSA